MIRRDASRYAESSSASLERKVLELGQFGKVRWRSPCLTGAPASMLMDTTLIRLVANANRLTRTLHVARLENVIYEGAQLRVERECPAIDTTQFIN